MAMKKKMKGNITSPALPGKSILAEVNNNEAGNIYNSLFAKNRKVEYDNKDMRWLISEPTRITSFSV